MLQKMYLRWYLNFIFFNIFLYVECNKYEAPCFKIANIVGGEEIYERIPYQVSMQYIRPGKQNLHFCGASIISKYHVLTAAHCLKRLDLRNVLIVAGTNNLKSSRSIIKRIQNIYSHRQAHIYTDDIAIVVIDTPFDFSDRSIAPINVLDQEYIASGIPVTVTGWGARIPIGYDTLPEYISLTDQLKALDYTTISNEKCISMGAQMITRNQLCTIKGLFEGACVGDSGSPLVTLINNSLFQVGIVSYGNVICGLPTSPDIFTRVHQYNDWIKKILSSIESS